MKYVLVIGDGMADAPIAELRGNTPLEALDLPAFDALAGGEIGLCRTVPEGVAPGSDTAILNIFGCDPRVYYTGRSVLEAAGVGVRVQPGEVSLRLNLCAVEGGAILSHNGGGVEGDEAEGLMRALLADPAFQAAAAPLGLRVKISRTFRHIGVIRFSDESARFELTPPHNVLGESVEKHMPRGALAKELGALMRLSYNVLNAHPINCARRARGDLPANMLWPWAEARAAALPDFSQKYAKTGAVISAVPLLHGIALLSGLDVINVPGANGDLDTNYEGKAQAALEALKTHDFVCVHVEAPDEMSHAGSLEKKLEAIRRLEARTVRPLMAGLAQGGAPYRLLLLSDHPTLLSTRTHDASPVPYALYDSRTKRGARKFCEKTCAGGNFVPNGDRLMPLLFEEA